MSKRTKKRTHKTGLPPGTPVYVGDIKTEQVRITVIDYDNDRFEMKEVRTAEECFPFKERPTVTWINVDGVHEVPLIEKLGGHFGFHPLIVEDIVNTEQRPKTDFFDNYVFTVIKMYSIDTVSKQITSEQVSIIFGENFVITFQEGKEGDPFDSVRNRLQNNKGKIRKAGPDYLAYSLIDSVIDNYFKVLEFLGEEIEYMEDELVTNPSRSTLQKIHSLKREMIYLRKSVWPLREIISSLQREETPLIKDTTRIYLGDIYDHTIQVIDSLETYRDIISGMMDVYLSSISNRMNEVMKVLTIFAAIFIPLTFIAGIYGMNFNVGKSPFNMPELNWYFGYPFALALMAGTAIILLIFFKKKKWL